MKKTWLYPWLFYPVCKDYLWGGRRIAARFRRPGTPAVCAESWEISGRPEGMSVIANGPLQGRTLAAIAGTFTREVVGSKACARPIRGFPLLVKLIDARLRLSVQVHPDEDSAPSLGGEPKTEMWYVLEAQPGSVIYAGLKRGANRQLFERALAENRIAERLATVRAVPGQALLIRGGCVHAIGEGCLLLEIQQSSDTTYRLYDWGRVDRDGKPRPLHVEQALRAIRWGRLPPRPARTRATKTAAGNTITRLAITSFFRVSRLDIRAAESFPTGGRSFHAFFTVAGRAQVETDGAKVPLKGGLSCLLPAAVGRYRLLPGPRGAELIRITL